MNGMTIKCIHFEVLVANTRVLCRLLFRSFSFDKVDPRFSPLLGDSGLESSKNGIAWSAIPSDKFRILLHSPAKKVDLYIKSCEDL